MEIVRLAAFVLAAFGLTVAVSGQGGGPDAPLRTVEKQSVIGGVKIESLATRQTRIEAWLNTSTYLAFPVYLEADSFTVRQEANGGVLIQSASPVRVTGLALGQGVSNVPILDTVSGTVLTWPQGFKLRILANGTPEWFCCPRKD